ncbi:hypothetical protein Peur_054595 [Populus x canadensis]
MKILPVSHEICLGGIELCNALSVLFGCIVSLEVQMLMKSFASFDSVFCFVSPNSSLAVRGNEEDALKVSLGNIFDYVFIWKKFCTFC